MWCYCLRTARSCRSNLCRRIGASPRDGEVGEKFKVFLRALSRSFGEPELNLYAALRNSKCFVRRAGIIDLEAYSKASISS